MTLSYSLTQRFEIMTTTQLEQLLDYAFCEGKKDGRAPELTRAFLEFLKMLKQIEPVRSSPEIFWECPWIQTRGRRVDWHSCNMQIYQGVAYFSLKSRYTFAVDIKKKEFTGLRLVDFDGTPDAGYKLAEWLLAEFTSEIKKILVAPEQYNRSIARRLPYRYRLGKIQREQVWKHQTGKLFVKDELTSQEIQDFLKAVQTNGVSSSIDAMCRDRFLEICSMAYDAIFPGDPACSRVERYRLHADGRDDGLLKLPAQDAEAFEEWIREGSKIGHPWEIVRGGNSTHIFLQCCYKEGQWKLYLAGSSAVCAAQTVKISIALHRAGIPFELIEKEHMTQLVYGKDWIGIVPEDIYPFNCYDLFEPYGTEEFKTFMNLGDFEKEKGFISEVYWYPVRPLQICAPKHFACT